MVQYVAYQNSAGRKTKGRRQQPGVDANETEQNPSVSMNDGNEIAPQDDMEDE